MKNIPTSLGRKHPAFTKSRILEAAESGIYPLGMTAQDLIETRFFDAKSKVRFSALHVAAERSRFPPGTTFQDLVSASRNMYCCVKTVFSQLNRKTVNRWPEGTTAKDLVAVKDEEWGNCLVRCAVLGHHHYPPGTSTEDLKIDNKFVPLQFAVMFGNLLPGTTIQDLKTRVTTGKRPWWHALKLFESRRRFAINVRNVLACPELAGQLDLLNNEYHRKILKRVLASPQMTPAIRGELTKFPDVCASML